ncbi:Ycf48-like protein [compost metagenome]
MSSTRRVSGLFACVVIASLHGVDTFADDAVIDPLNRASIVSARASMALLTAVEPTGGHLVAVGERGIILLSKDDGRTWVQAQVPTSLMLTSVRFANTENGWAVGHGGIILATSDGGRAWQKQLDGISAAQLLLEAARANQDADPRQLAYAERMVSEGADKPFLDLLVQDERTITVVGAFGLAFRSNDGGRSWQPWSSHIPNGQGSHLYAIRQIAQTQYIAGEMGAVFRSNDGGESFTRIETPYEGSFFGLVLVSPEHMLVYGLRGNVYLSKDGGANWQKSQLDTEESLTAGSVLKDGSIVLGNQAGGLYRSTDGGLSFASVPLGNPAPIVALAESAGNSLILAGARGTVRLSEAALNVGNKQ